MQLGTYRHYKGNLYQVVGLALNSDTEEEMVVYKPLYETDVISKDMFFVRDKKIFLEEVEVRGKKIPRFEYITEQKND
jgi:hypothetical protein